MHSLSSRVKGQRGAKRGFTIAELLAVIAIIAILAVIATVSFRRFIASSKTGEAIHMIGSIKAAQESYKDETFAYLNVSPGLSASSDFYPDNPLPGKQKMNFAGTGTGQAAWQQLGVRSDAPVLFVYACTAGAAGSAPSSPGSDITVGNWPTTAAQPWYVVKARADLDGDGVNTVFVSGSFTGEIFAANQ